MITQNTIEPFNLININIQDIYKPISSSLLTDTDLKNLTKALKHKGLNYTPSTQINILSSKNIKDNNYSQIPNKDIINNDLVALQDYEDTNFLLNVKDAMYSTPVRVAQVLPAIYTSLKATKPIYKILPLLTSIVGTTILNTLPEYTQMRRTITNWHDISNYDKQNAEMYNQVAKQKVINDLKFNLLANTVMHLTPITLYHMIKFPRGV